MKCPQTFARVREVNLHFFEPANKSEKVTRGNVYALGDAHANPKKILKYLCYADGVTIDRDTYVKLCRAYNRFDIDTFIKQLQNIRIDNKKTPLFCFIGDLLADRGLDDRFILEIFKQLSECEAEYEIIFSNHDAEFLLHYYRDFYAFHPSTVYHKQCPSLQRFVNHAGDTKAAYRKIFEQAYLPKLKLFSYSISGKTITLFSHAPVNSLTVEHAASKFKVREIYFRSYPTNKALFAAMHSDANLAGLVIDAINIQFRNWITTEPDNVIGELERQIHAVGAQQTRHHMGHNSQINNDSLHWDCPIGIATWNRAHPKAHKPFGSRGVIWKYVHGHTGKAYLPVKGSDYVTLDYSDLGKGQSHNKGKLYYFAEPGQQVTLEYFKDSINELKKLLEEIQQQSLRRNYRNLNDGTPIFQPPLNITDTNPTEICFNLFTPRARLKIFSSKAERVTESIKQCNDILANIDELNGDAEPDKLGNGGLAQLSKDFTALSRNVKHLAEECKPSLADRLLKTLFKSVTFLMVGTGYDLKGVIARRRCEDHKSLSNFNRLRLPGLHLFNFQQDQGQDQNKPTPRGHHGAGRHP